jgi:hypothetical protein
VRVRFHSAEIHEENSTVATKRQITRMFDLPRRARWVRILHLVRVSASDHNAAILAANDIVALDTITSQVEADRGMCRPQRQAYCSWVPQGVAVIPEAKADDQWKPQ